EPALGSFFFSSRRRHTRLSRDWSSDVCSSDLAHRSRQSPIIYAPRLRFSAKPASSEHAACAPFQGGALADRATDSTRMCGLGCRLGEEIAGAEFLAEHHVVLQVAEVSQQGLDFQIGR